MLILLLNLRGLVYQEGTQPVAHMDYIIIIAACVAGLGRPAKLWINSIAAIFAAGLLGFILNLGPFIRSVSAILNGTANVAGWDGQAWAGQYFRVGEMSVNQTAFLTGITLTLSLAACFRWRGLAQRCAVLTAMAMTALSFATGSRLALLGAPLAALVSLALIDWRHRHKPAMANESEATTAQPGTRGLRSRAKAMMLTAGVIAGSLVLFQSGRGWLLQNYVSRKLVGDQGRLDVLACYTTLPFSDGSRWALGAGFGEAGRRFCDEDVGIYVSHAHNFVAQLMGESGLIATVAVLAALAALWSPILNRKTSSDDSPAPSSDAAQSTAISLFMAAYFFILLFALFELAFLKVTVLECLIGYLLSMSFCGGNSGQGRTTHHQPITSSTAP